MCTLLVVVFMSKKYRNIEISKYTQSFFTFLGSNTIPINVEQISKYRNIHTHFLLLFWDFSIPEYIIYTPPLISRIDFCVCREYYAKSCIFVV